MLSIEQKYNYIIALQSVGQKSKYYKTAKVLLGFINEYGYDFAGKDIHDKDVEDKIGKSILIFEILEKYVKIGVRDVPEFWTVVEFNIPRDICRKLQRKYSVLQGHKNQSLTQSLKDEIEKTL